MTEKHFILKLKDMREIVREEMLYVPRGDSAQNSLRQAYWTLRMSSLGKHSNPYIATKEDVLKEAIKIIREDESDFEPKYDKKYFKNLK